MSLQLSPYERNDAVSQARRARRSRSEAPARRRGPRAKASIYGENVFDRERGRDQQKGIGGGYGYSMQLGGHSPYGQLLVQVDLEGDNKENNRATAAEQTG